MTTPTTNPFCQLDGMHVSECPHVPCGECGATVGVCGGCFRCRGCHEVYAACQEWLIGVEVVGYFVEEEGGGDAKRG